MKKSREEVLKLLKKDGIKLCTVSGIFTTKPTIIKWTEENIPEFVVLTSKSYQVVPTKGNREPIITEHSVGNYGNAVGLPNPGMEKGHKELTELRKKHDFKAIVNISIAGCAIQDFITQVRKFDDVADMIELNFSCPHAEEGYGSSIGSSAKLVAEYVRALKKETDALLFPKLTPNVDNVGEIAKAAIDAGADGIVAINTIGPVVYTEPHTSKPILYNPGGRKGGKSGDWVKNIALKQIKEIREAVGPDIPIIGMGGITTGKDVKNMHDAGADVVGIGSVMARVNKMNLPKFVTAIKKDAEEGTDNASEFMLNDRLMEYKPFKINKINEIGDNLRVFELHGSIKYDPSQFAFLWLPEAGEKPFSIALENPLTFVVRRMLFDKENEKGLVTDALFKLNEGDTMMIRGVYGYNAPYPDRKKAVILTGGTGIAVVPKLAEVLKGMGKEVVVYYGVKISNEAVLTDEIGRYAECKVVADDGVLGRVLKVMEEDLKQEDMKNACCYNIGPVQLMFRAMEVQAGSGCSSDDIFSSIEANTMCGVNMCGQCECGGRFTCQEGTFLSKRHLEEKGVDIREMGH